MPTPAWPRSEQRLLGWEPVTPPQDGAPEGQGAPQVQVAPLSPLCVAP